MRQKSVSPKKRFCRDKTAGQSPRFPRTIKLDQNKNLAAFFRPSGVRDRVRLKTSNQTSVTTHTYWASSKRISDSGCLPKQLCTAFSRSMLFLFSRQNYFEPQFSTHRTVICTSSIIIKNNACFTTLHVWSMKVNRNAWVGFKDPNQ